MNKQQMSWGAIVSYLIILVKLISGLIYVPIIVRYLGNNEYGIYSLVTSFTGYLTIFSSGMNAAYIRFYVQTKVKNKNGLDKLNGQFLKIFLFLALISAIVCVIIGMYAPQLFGSKISYDEYTILKHAFYVLSAIIFFTIINCCFSSVIIANEKYIFAKCVELLNAIVTPMIAIPLLINGFGSVVILIVSLGVMILTVFFNALFCFKKLGIIFDLKEKNNGLILSIISFSIFVTIQSVMDQLNWQIDKLILARTQGTAEISIYTIGSTLNTYYIVISSAMSPVFIAQINKLVAQNRDKELSELFVKSSRIFAEVVFLIMSGYIFFGRQFIEIWVGVEYTEAYYVGLLIMLPVTIALTQGLGLDIVRAKNKHKIQIVINFIVCLFNVLLSIPLAHKWGAIGSASGTFVSEIIICVIVQGVYYYKIADIDMVAYLKEMIHLIRGLVVPILVGILILLVQSDNANILSLGAKIIFYSMVYFGSMWLWGMRKTEKDMIKNIILHLLIKNR